MRFSKVRLWKKGKDRENGSKPDATLSKEMKNALAVRSKIFKPRPNDIDTCAWYVRTVDPSDFCFDGAADFGLPSIFGERAFEYAGTWVEHYYYELVQHCKRCDRMDIVRMLYNWYIAQFTIDYLNDVFPLTSGQYLESSALNPLSAQGILHASTRRFPYPCLIETLKRRKIEAILLASREQMEFHEMALAGLPNEEIVQPIRNALDGFYTTVEEQFNLSQKELFDSMNLGEYYSFRTLNAGGEMGFLRQTYLFSLLDPDIPIGEGIGPLGHVVGKNIALINDLYGLKKDVPTGDPNIILKHHDETGCSLEASVKWATEEIVETVRIINTYNEENPNNLETKYDVAMCCVSGNHGAHATCKRFDLPVDFVWPEELYGS